MRLVITEKPSVARSIAEVIGANKRQDGYLEGNAIQTTMDIYADCTEDKKKDVIQKIEDRIFVM